MIIHSAIKFYLKDDVGCKYPIIMTGLRHSNILEQMFHLHLDYDKESAVQGFLTDSNQFVNRYEAKRIARYCGQIKEDLGYLTLYSEEIWPN